MSNLPQKIKLTIHGEEIDFSLTDKREIKYYGKTETSNESLWRVDKLKDNEVLYQTEWGWGVFVNIEERELSLEERSIIAGSNHNEVSQNIKMFTGIDEDHTLHKNLDDNNIPTRLITLTYNNEKIKSYE